MKKENFNQIYKEYKPQIKNHIRLKIKNFSKCCQFDVEELTNDVLLKIYNNIEGFNPELSSLNTWIYNITKNTIIDWNRGAMKKQDISVETIKSYKKDEIIIDLPDNSIKNNFNSYDNEIINKKINESIGNLKGIAKDICNLYFINELKLEEISVKLNIPINTVKTKIRRSRLILQKELINIY